MFEWGYLLRSLPDRYIHVYLIGITRKDVPTDLQGSWCEEVRFCPAVKLGLWEDPKLFAVALK
jgi:hypothetical protein